MQIQFFGAAGTVTGSCYLLTTSKSFNILIDCGMFQGTDVSQYNYDPLPFDVKSISAVALTHAHLDHCGRLPLLVKAGFKGKIYTTQATKLLVSIALMDAVKVANEHQQDRQPLFSEEDVQKTIQLIEIVSYDESISLLGNVHLIFRNAGHILGSASIEIHDEGKIVLFSGDLGNPHQKLLQPRTLIPHADIVIVESTYGDRMHPRIDALQALREQIVAIEQSKGVLLLPAFALDRTQVLLHLLNHLKQDGSLRTGVPVFLDSPMGIHATAVYKQCTNLWSDELRSHPSDPFSFPDLTVTEDAKESEKIVKVSGPKIIVAGNGMMNGGRIWHHLINYLPLSSTRLVVVGYQGEGTIGRTIIEGAKQVRIYHETVPVHASIETIEGLSAHADQHELLTWVESIQGIQQLFITHGDDPSRQQFVQLIKNKTTIANVTVPIKNSSYQV